MRENYPRRYRPSSISQGSGVIAGGAFVGAALAVSGAAFQECFETHWLIQDIGGLVSSFGASLSIVFFGGAIQLCIFIPIWDTCRYTELFFGAYLWVNSDHHPYSRGSGGLQFL